MNQNITGQTGACLFFGNCFNGSITNSTFKNFPCNVISIVSGKNFLIKNNTFEHVFAGVGLQTCQDITVDSNIFDMSILNESDSLYYFQKSWRYSAIGGYYLSKNTTISNNKIVASNWGMEFTPNTGGKINIYDNYLNCEATGISIGGTAEANIINNIIYTPEGFNEMGIEIGDAFKFVISDNNIDMKTSLYGSSRAISNSKSNSIVDGQIKNNTLKSVVGVYFGSTTLSSSGTLSIMDNHIYYDCISIFTQYVRVYISNNIMKKRNDYYLWYLQNSNINVSSDYVNIINNNVFDCSMDGAFLLNKGFGATPSGKYIVTNNKIINSYTNSAFLESSNTQYLHARDNILIGTVPTTTFSLTNVSGSTIQNNYKEDGTNLS